MSENSALAKEHSHEYGEGCYRTCPAYLDSTRGVAIRKAQSERDQLPLFQHREPQYIVETDTYVDICLCLDCREEIIAP